MPQVLCVICTLFVFQNFGAFAVELVFPQCAEIRIPDSDVLQNDKTIASVMSGDASKCQTGVRLLAGSRAEGFAMEPGWGHEKPDEDVMIIYGGSHTVATIPNDDTENAFKLTLRTDDCYPAYCRISVDGFLEEIKTLAMSFKQRTRQCIVALFNGKGIMYWALLLAITAYITCEIGVWNFLVIPLLPLSLSQSLGLIGATCCVVLQTLIVRMMCGRTVDMAIKIMCLLNRSRPQHIMVLGFVACGLEIMINIYPDIPSMLRLFIANVKHPFYQLIETACSHSSSEDCIYWVYFIFTNLEHAAYCSILLLSICMIHDAYNHKFTLTTYQIMTDLSCWSPGVLNKWLIYVTRGETRWLSSTFSIEKRTDFDISQGTVSGPSQTYCGYDSVPTLLCSAPFPPLTDHLDKWRRVSWPNTDLLSTIAKIPCLLVPVGHSYERK